MTIVFQSAQFIFIPQDYPLTTTCFYVESTLQENAPLHLMAQKCVLQYQTVLSFLPLFSVSHFWT